MTTSEPAAEFSVDVPAELTQDDLDLIKATVDRDRIETVWVGESRATELVCDLHVSEQESEAVAVERISALLQDKGIIFRAW